LSFDAVADTYDEIRVIPDWVLRKFYEKILMKETRFNRDLVVLDGGVGTGRTIGPILNLGIQLVGIDISRKMLERASEKLNGKSKNGRVSLIRGSVTELPFRPHSFDIVVSVHVLWLLKKWKQAVLEARRVLKAEGHFISAKHNSPEFEGEVGRKLLGVEQNAFGQTRLSPRLDIFKKRRIAKEVLNHKAAGLLIRVLENIPKYYSLDSFLIRKTSSNQKYMIVWKEAANVSTIASLLDERLSSLKWSISPETFRKLKRDITNWRIKKTKENPYIEIGLEFVFTVVTFNAQND